MGVPNVRQTNLMQTRNITSKDHSQHGQALVEFALVLLFIILPLIFVFVEGALLLFTLANVTNAAREGARAGSIYQTSTSSGTYAAIDVERVNCIRTDLGVTGLTTTCQADPYGHLRNLVNVNQCSITADYGPAVPAATNPFRQTDTMTVTVACPHRLLFGLVSAGSITLTSRSTMKIEPGGPSPQ
jgi:Flp pilus assembly protein TadG